MQHSLQVVIRQMFVLCSLAKQFQRRGLLEIGQSETRIVCGDHVCQRIGKKCAIFIEDLPQLLPTKFRFIWLSSLRREDCYKIGQLENKNYLWRPCLLTDWDEMSNLYRRSSIVASCQVSVHLAKNFQRRRFLFLICQSETRIANRSYSAILATLQITSYALGV